MSNNKPIGRLIDRYELPGRILADFQSLFGADPVLARQLALSLADAMVGWSAPDAPSGGAFAKIEAVFAQNGNAPLTKAELTARSGLKRGTVHTILYRSHTERFDVSPSPGGGRAKVYRLIASDAGNQSQSNAPEPPRENINAAA